MYDFGLKLRKLRKSRGITQKRLAAMLGVTEGTISKYESNLVMPPFEAMRSLSKILGTSLDELYGNEAKGTISTNGLSEEQGELVRNIIDTLRCKNGIAAKKITKEQFELLGRLTVEFLK